MENKETVFTTVLTVKTSIEVKIINPAESLKKWQELYPEATIKTLLREITEREADKGACYGAYEIDAVLEEEDYEIIQHLPESGFFALQHGAGGKSVLN